MAAQAGRVEMEREGSEQSQASILGGDTLQVPRRAQSELGQPLPSEPKKEFRSLKSPFNSATLQKTEKKFKKRCPHVNKAPCGFKTLFPLIYMHRPHFSETFSHEKTLGWTKFLQRVNYWPDPRRVRIKQEHVEGIKLTTGT